MKILINVTPLQSSLSGIGHYSYHLTRLLMEHPGVSDVRGISALRQYNRKDIEALLQEIDQPGETHASSQRKYKDIALTVVKKIPGARNIKHSLERYRAKRESERYTGHVYWEPNYILLPFEGPSVTTIHDISHVYYPRFHPDERVRLLNEQLPESISRASELTVVSEFTRKEVSSYYGVDKANISVIPPGVSNSFYFNYDAESIYSLRDRYRLPENYILSVGTIEPRKNLSGLLDAYVRLPEKIRQRYPLVIVGAKGWKPEKIEPILQRLESQGEIIRLGYIAQRDVPKLYSAATILAYVSFYEGFGMPIAEAMASGTAVLTSDRTAMPEVAGGCAELVNPDDGDDILRGLLRLIEDVPYRQSLAASGLQRADNFRWQLSAERLYQVFQRAGES